MCVAEVVVLISEGGEILIKLHLAFDFLPAFIFAPEEKLDPSSLHGDTLICTRVGSMLLLDSSLEEFLLRGPETSSDRNLGPLVAFVFLSLY